MLFLSFYIRGLTDTKGVIWMEDKKIIDLYMERSESAISETEKKYGRYCRYIARRILENDGDADEIANDTYLRLWESIPPACPGSLKAYIAVISRRLALNRYEREHAQKRGSSVELLIGELHECVPENAAFEDGIALRDALNTFLGSLPTRTQKIFVRRYWYASPIEEISREYSISRSSVRVLLFRTRKNLKKYLEKEGF